ncbi:RHS repeat-associated core domain-containing protein [Chryseobacterium bernardetii]|uniref:RHS repeat-associated core domain-containing protein n=1 Tax=Chryseobacterium bernardetii TaxID=1241978 RepID=UPI003AF81E1A
MSFAKDSAGGLEVTDTNNYYPFGLNHISGMFGSSNFGGYYSYKYNGKELQETGMYDYGARMYMPDLGRWGVVDPLAETSRRWSTYNYAFNNPIRFIDPDGRQGTDIYELNKKGELIWRAASNTDIIYTSKNFDSKGEVKANNDGGYIIGEKGFIEKHTQTDGTRDFLDFGSDQDAGLNYFNQATDWIASGDIDAEMGIQTANLSGGDHTVVYSGSEDGSTISPVYDNKSINVSLQGHTHNDKLDTTILRPGVLSTGPLNPSGVYLSKIPTKENNYSFEVGKTVKALDIKAATPNGTTFISVPKHNTTIIYDNTTMLKAYEGKYTKN